MKLKENHYYKTLNEDCTLMVFIYNGITNRNSMSIHVLVDNDGECIPFEIDKNTLLTPDSQIVHNDDTVEISEEQAIAYVL